MGNINSLYRKYIFITLLLASCSAVQGKVKVDKSLKYCADKIQHDLHTMANADSTLDYSMVPKHILKGQSKWELSKITQENWIAGFWPGILWYDYAYTHNPNIKLQAERYTNSLKFLSTIPAYDHDLGFLIFCSYGNGYKITHNPKYKKIIIQTADTLATLFNPKVGTILSWPNEVKEMGWPHNTIMDNMMNLEMLFWASKHGGNKKLYNIAVSHADKTMKYQFRTDYSNYHVAVYDTTDGHFIKGVTHQGYSDNSMWARGQSWAIYGFTMVYRETKDKKYLDFVQKVADIYIKRLPKDYIPYWDFDDPNIPNTPRDASAACITASALLELSTYLPSKKGAYYRGIAEKILDSLSTSKYQSRNQNEAFLLHSTGHWPNHSEIDASIIYADYYYIEALTRLKLLQEHKTLNLE